MNCRRSFLFFIIVLLAIPSSIDAYYVVQNDWSGGDGVPGPVVLYWDDSFLSQYQTGWYTIPPGKLYLGISSTQHVIGTTVPGADFAFPVDMDGDGDTDAVSSSPLSSGDYRIAWYENDGTGGGWAEHVVIDAALFRCVYPGDIDLDGDIDLVGGNKAIGGKGIEWFRNDDGVGDAWTRFRIAYWGSPTYVCCSDINNDDTLEVIAPSYTSPHEIAWWESTTWPPDTTWSKTLVSGGVDYGRELFTIDLDQDGDIDIVSADEDQNGLKWFENADGLGLSWSVHGLPGVYDYPYSVHASDIDGDGDIDVVYCSQDSEKASWCENLDSAGTSWQEHLIEDELENPQGIHCADVTGDGYTDVIVALSTGSAGKKLYLYRNIDGSGLEWARFQIASGSCFEDADVADFDQDGDEDILSAASLGTYVSWHELEGYTDGWLLSSILDLNSYPQWDSITWIAEEPLGTDIFFQVRSSNDWENMGTWCDTIFQPRTLAGIIDSTHRYIQYRVGMTSDTEFLTPVLDQVRFYWTYLGIEGDENPDDFEVYTYPNPASGSVNISIPAPFIGSTEILIYDLSGKLVRKFSDLETNAIQWDCDDEFGNEIPSGIYMVRGNSDEISRTVRFVKL